MTFELAPSVVAAATRAFDRFLGLEKAKSKAHVLVVEHPDGKTTHTEHPSRSAAHAAAAAHLEANGGSGKLVIAPKGKEHTVKPVPAKGGIKPAGPKAPGGGGGAHGGGKHHNQYTKADLASASLEAGGKLPPSLIDRVEVFTPIAAVRKEGGKKASYQGIPLLIDRPKGFVQEGKSKDGTPWKRVYRYDYGFVPKTEGGDGEGLDVFLGPSANAPISWWAIQTKADDAGGVTFDEFKVFLGFSSPSLAKSCYGMHIPVEFCAGWFPVPVSFMKSLLGVEPRAVIKALMRKAMGKKIAKLAPGVSFETVNSALNEALRTAYPPTKDPSGCSSYGPYATEVYEDHVIYSKDDSYFQESYSFANGVVTLAGSPVEVVRTYVPAAGVTPAAPAGQPAPVTQAAKNETKKKAEAAMAKAKAAVAKAGGADIVALAAERLQLVADELGKGEGTITAEVASEIDAVGSLLETARELYSGAAATEGAGEEEGGEGGEETELDPEKEMAELADAEKSGGIVKMRGPRFIAYSVSELKKINAETDPLRKALRAASLEKALTYANYWAGANFTGDTEPTFPVSVFLDAGAPGEAAVPSAGGEPSKLGPAANGGATGVGGSGNSQTSSVTGTASFTEKMDQVTKALEALKSGKPIPEGTTATTKNEPAAGLWPASYVEALPDSAFLYVEANANKSAGGNTDTAFRHFPIRDVAGQLSKAQLAQAIKMIPTFGATPEFKADLLAKANGLFGLEASVEKSASLAGARGDDGWPADMTDPDFMQGRKPHAAAKVFGFDNIPAKLEKLGVTTEG